LTFDDGRGIGLIQSLDKKTGRPVWSWDLYKQGGTNLGFGYSSSASVRPTESRSGRGTTFRPRTRRRSWSTWMGRRSTSAPSA